MPIYLCLYRIMKRRFMYRNKVRPDMTDGCKEGIDFEFFSWVLNYNKKVRSSIMNILNKYKDKNRIILNSKKEVKKFIENINLNRD